MNIYLSPTILISLAISYVCLYIAVFGIVIIIIKQNAFNRKTKVTFKGIVEWVQKIENYVKQSTDKKI